MFCPYTSANPLLTIQTNYDIYALFSLISILNEQHPTYCGKLGFDDFIGEEKMRPWIESAIASPQDSMNVRQTVSCVEIQQQVPNVPVKYNTYLLRYTENSFLSVAHLGLEVFFRNMDQQLLHPTLGSTWAKTYRETWPTLFSMLDNTVNRSLSKGALLRIDDPDNGDQKWVIGTFLGNVDLSNLSKEYKQSIDKQFIDAHVFLIQTCAKIVNELETRQPNKLKLFFRGSVAGGIEWRKLASQLESTWMPILKTLFGAG